MGKTTSTLLYSLKQNMQIERDCHGYVQGDVSDAGLYLDYIFKHCHMEQEDGKEVLYDQAILLPPNNGGVIRCENFQAIGKLYKALTQQVGGYSIKFAIQNRSKRQLFISQQYSEGWVNLGNKFEVQFKLDKDSNNHNATGMRKFGSKRQIEWERTLSCRLYEEQWHSTVGLLGDEQGMDLLWEVANDDEVENTKRIREEDENKMKNWKGNEKMTKMNGKRQEKINDDVIKRCKKGEEEEKEEEMVIGQFCCLQALKFSRGGMRKLGAGKMKKLGKVAKILKRSFRYF